MQCLNGRLLSRGRCQKACLSKAGGGSMRRMCSIGLEGCQERSLLVIKSVNTFERGTVVLWSRVGSVLLCRENPECEGRAKKACKYVAGEFSWRVGGRAREGQVW